MNHYHLQKPPNQPKTVILFFRDDYLTRPKLATTKEVKFKVENYMTEYEPILKRLVYKDFKDNIGGSLPIYAYKHYLQNDINKEQKKVLLPFVDIEYCILSSYGQDALNLAKKIDGSVQNEIILEGLINFSFNSYKEKVIENITNTDKNNLIASPYLNTAKELLDFDKQIDNST